ncbi:MAG TPA: GAF domain-containing protein, partial [Gemmataceae bacterium]
LAAAAVVAAWLVRAALAGTLLDRYPYTTFYFPIVVAAWYGGAGPALLAVALGAIVGGWESFPPDRGPWAAVAAGPIRVAVFVLYGSLIAALGGLYRGARRRAADQIAEARRQAAERERAERRYRRLIEGSPLSVEVVAADGHIREVNPAWEQFWGLTLDQAAGYSLLEDRQLDAKGVMPYVRRAFAGETVVVPAFDYVMRAGKFKGQPRWVRTVIYPVRGDRGAVEEVVLIQEDVSSSKREEDRLRVLAEAGRLLGASLDYETTLADLCRLVVPVLADWCAVDLWDGDQDVRRLAVYHADPAKVELAEEFRRRYPPRPDDAGGLMHVLRTGEPELYPEITDDMIDQGGRDDDHRRIIRELGLASGLVVPLTARGRTLGALTLATAESGRHFGPADLSLAQELAARAALAVDNARLFAEARQAAERHRTAEEQLALLAEASASLGSSPELPAVLAAVLALARRLVAADAYAVWRQRAETGRWSIDVADGLSETYRNSNIRILDETPALSAEPVVADDVTRLPALAHRRAMYEAEGIRSLLAVPLRIHGTPCGTLVFYFRTPHAFTRVEVRVGTALGDLAAAAIGSAELYEAQARMRADAEAARHRLAFLAEASAALVSTLDEEITLQTIAALAVPDLADWCVVDLLRPDGTVRRITGRHSDPAKDRWLPELIAHGPTAAVDVLRNGRPTVVNEVADG